VAGEDSIRTHEVRGSLREIRPISVGALLKPLDFSEDLLGEMIGQNQADESQNLEPITKNALMRAYRRISKHERKEEKSLEKAAVRPALGELE
jgi:hypothetical protein